MLIAVYRYRKTKNGLEFIPTDVAFLNLNLGAAHVD